MARHEDHLADLLQPHPDVIGLPLGLALVAGGTVRLLAGQPAGPALLALVPGLALVTWTVRRTRALAAHRLQELGTGTGPGPSVTNGSG